MNKNFAKSAGVFLLFVIGFWAISAIYLSPAIGGEKVLKQGDMQQVRLMRAEMDSFKARYGEFPGWADGLFSGMPTTLITGIPTGNFIYLSGILEFFHLVGTPFNFLFVAMLGMFVLLVSSGVNRWLAAAGGIGYAFMTYSITSYEAGHVTKVLAMGAVPGMLAGLVLLNRKNYLLGISVLGVFFTLVVGYFHYQIAYYAGIMAGIFLLVEVFRAIVGKDIKHALIMGSLGVAGLLAGALSNFGKLVDTMEYSSATMRGGSEVASEVPKNGPKQSEIAKSGLERDYAFAWSYSPKECFTLFVPRLVGGSTNENVGMNDITQDESPLPLYFGDLNFTSGPVYIGAVFVFLFILGIITILMLAKSSPKEYSRAKGIMWFSIIAVAVSIILAWGRFFFINDWLFDNLPYYNKFRTPMMTLSIAQIIVPFFGLYAVQRLLSAENREQVMERIFKIALISTGALMAVAAFLISSSDFSSARDLSLEKSGWPKEAVNQLKDLRSSIAWKDWLRTLVFMGITFALVWYVTLKKGNKRIAWIGILVLAAVDMVGVSNRYLTEENWEYKDEEEMVMPSEKDRQLMAVNKSHARVFDLRYDPFNDAHSAPWHRNIGGYHPAKLSRYQDIISYCITPNGGNLTFENMMNNNALDMLNCGYILAMSEDKKQEQVYQRPTAIGNSWFVSKVIYAKNAQTAIETINKFNPRQEVVIENSEKIKPSADSFVVDSNVYITMSNYSLDTIHYKVNNPNKGLAVFSEVYYNEKNGSWKALVDGKELPIIQVNYILRGVELPAGSKEVMLYFNKKNNRFLSVEMAASGLLLVLLALSLVKSALRKEEITDAQITDV